MIFRVSLIIIFPKVVIVLNKFLDKIVLGPTNSHRAGDDEQPLKRAIKVSKCDYVRVRLSVWALSLAI